MPTSRIGPAIGALVTTVLLAGCGGGGTPDAHDPSDLATAGFDATECPGLVPDADFATLGWGPRPKPTFASSTCTYTTSRGAVRADKWPVIVLAGDDPAAKASAALADECTKLGGTDTAARQVTAAGVEACARLPRNPKNNFSLFLVTPGHEVLRFRIEPDVFHPTARATVLATLRQLGESALG